MRECVAVQVKMRKGRDLEPLWREGERKADERGVSEFEAFGVYICT